MLVFHRRVRARRFGNRSDVVVAGQPLRLRNDLSRLPDPRKYQYSVLFWGVLGAVFLRLAFILAGAAMVRRFEVLLVVLGGFLIYSGFRPMIIGRLLSLSILASLSATRREEA